MSKSPDYPLVGRELEADGSPLATYRWRVRVVPDQPLSQEEAALLQDSLCEVAERAERTEELLEAGVSAARTSDEGRISVDLNLLRNVAEIRRLREKYPDISVWTLVSEGHDDEDPERLVGETIRLLTGVLAGCDVSEIRQGKSETFESVWSRVNVARLMAEESQLQELPDPITGAGLFTSV